MSFFDDIKAKAEELLGGAGEDVGGTINDTVGSITDHTDQLQDILPGGGENNEENK